jgi:hypothetical protein
VGVLALGAYRDECMSLSQTSYDITILAASLLVSSFEIALIYH